MNGIPGSLSRLLFAPITRVKAAIGTARASSAFPTADGQTGSGTVTTCRLGCAITTRQKRFFGTFDSGAQLSEGDPLMVLRNQLFMVRSKDEKIAASTQLAWVIKAWNAVRQGQRPPSFRLHEKKYPEPV